MCLIEWEEWATYGYGTVWNWCYLKFGFWDFHKPIWSHDWQWWQWYTHAWCAHFHYVRVCMWLLGYDELMFVIWTPNCGIPLVRMNHISNHLNKLQINCIRQIFVFYAAAAVAVVAADWVLSLFVGVSIMLLVRIIWCNVSFFFSIWWGEKHFYNESIRFNSFFIFCLYLSALFFFSFVVNVHFSLFYLYIYNWNEFISFLIMVLITFSTAITKVINLKDK